MNLLLKNFFHSYKQGEINLALTNKVNFKELYHLKKKKKKKSFNPKLNLCIVEHSETQTHKPMSSYIKTKEQMLFLTCCSEAESSLYRDNNLLDYN